MWVTEPGRVISRRWLVLRGHIPPTTDPPVWPAGGCRGQVRDNGDCSPNNASLMGSPQCAAPSPGRYLPLQSPRSALQVCSALCPPLHTGGVERRRWG